MGRKIFFYGLILLLSATGIRAQPYLEEINTFKKQDSINFPGTGKILFAGSSSFTNWTDVQAYFPAYPIINRGFGGSSLTDLLYYKKDIIFPYQPKQIVIYCGENDIAGSDTVTGQLVFERFKQLFEAIRAQFPSVPLLYISMKPSPSRWHLKEKMQEGNRLIRKFAEKKNKAVFLDVWTRMVGPDGKPLDDLFIEDKLHLNKKGYTIWQQLIAPHLLK